MQPATVVAMLQPFMARAHAGARPSSSPQCCLTFWLSRDGLSLRAASDFWKSDFDAVLTAVKHNGNALEYASENLRGVLSCFCSLLTYWARQKEYTMEGLSNIKRANSFKCNEVAQEEVNILAQQMFDKMCET